MARPPASTRRRPDARTTYLVAFRKTMTTNTSRRKPTSAGIAHDGIEDPLEGTTTGSSRGGGVWPPDPPMGAPGTGVMDPAPGGG